MTVIHTSLEHSWSWWGTYHFSTRNSGLEVCPAVRQMQGTPCPQSNYSVEKPTPCLLDPINGLLEALLGALVSVRCWGPNAGRHLFPMVGRAYGLRINCMNQLRDCSVLIALPVTLSSLGHLILPTREVIFPKIDTRTNTGLCRHTWV